MKHLADILKSLREDADLDQSEVAQHLGIPQQTYSNYERGRYDLERPQRSGHHHPHRTGGSGGAHRRGQALRARSKN